MLSSSYHFVILKSSWTSTIAAVVWASVSTWKQKKKQTKSKQEVSIHKSIYLWSLGTHTKVPAAAATTTKVALHGAKVRGLGVVVAHVVVVIAATAASTTTTIACDYRVCRIGQPQASYNSSKRQCNGIILP